MTLLLALAIASGLAILALAAARALERHGRTNRQREVDRDNLRHITGSRPWWREPPNEPPEGDH